MHVVTSQFPLFVSTVRPLYLRRWGRHQSLAFLCKAHPISELWGLQNTQQSIQKLTGKSPPTPPLPLKASRQERETNKNNSIIGKTTCVVCRWVECRTGSKFAAFIVRTRVKGSIRLWCDEPSPRVRTIKSQHSGSVRHLIPRRTTQVVSL